MMHGNLIPQRIIQSPAATRGFTLIELLVVLGILAMLVGVVSLSGPRLIATMEYREAVQGSYRLLRQARSLAIRSGEIVVVAVDLEKRLLMIEGRSEGLHFKPDIQLDLLVAAEFMEGDILRFRFYPDGSSTGGSLHLQRSAGHGNTLYVDWLTGRVRVVGDSA